MGNGFWKRLFGDEELAEEKAAGGWCGFSGIEDGIAAVNAVFSANIDMLIRRFTAADGTEYGLMFIEELVNKDELQRIVILPLLGSDNRLPLNSRHAAAETKTVSDPQKAADLICSGNILLFSSSPLEVTAIELRKPPKESGKESSPENIVMGPHERFGNTFKGNLSLLRNKIRNPKLSFCEFTVGNDTNTKVVLCHIDGIAKPETVKAAKEKIASCAARNIKSATQFLQLFKEDSISPFPQFISTERPDRTATMLLGGGIAIITDGSPWVILAPVSFTDFLKSPEDRNSPWIYTSIIRILRWLSVAITIIAPAFYVAVMSFHPGLLPEKFMLVAASGRAAVPFPAIAEVIIMEVFIELLREASTSMPSNIGSTISIVGGIVIGETAIAAGLASPLLVIIVAISAITSFTIPVYSMVISLRTVRFFSLILASMFGFFGLLMSIIFIITHMISLKSFGRDYLYPVAPMKAKRWMRDILQLPLRWIKGVRE